MAGLDPAIHDLLLASKNVDARDKPGHDDLCRKLCLDRAALTRSPCPGRPPRSWSSASPR
ncbi:hypothetical protein CV770_30195 [Bradyrhizobium sp. AC87j1]|nr:hypothetical protein CV770_30195 [Bradyrhizobium sp. AC87j1]